MSCVFFAGPKLFFTLHTNVPVTRLVSPCSYKDYRSNEDYSLTPQFWLISAVRFAFVILFEVSLWSAQQHHQVLAGPAKTTLAFTNLGSDFGARKFI